MFENSSVSPEHHESYGLARFSRIGGKSGKLFGSSIEHGTEMQACTKGLILL